MWVAADGGGWRLKPSAKKQTAKNGHMSIFFVAVVQQACAAVSTYCSSCFCIWVCEMIEGTGRSVEDWLCYWMFKGVKKRYINTIYAYSHT